MTVSAAQMIRLLAMLMCGAMLSTCVGRVPQRVSDDDATRTYVDCLDSQGVEASCPLAVRIDADGAWRIDLECGAGFQPLYVGRQSDEDTVDLAVMACERLLDEHYPRLSRRELEDSRTVRSCLVALGFDSRSGSIRVFWADGTPTVEIADVPWTRTEEHLAAVEGCSLQLRPPNP